MKLKNLFVLVATVFGLAISAHAQFGFDAFAGTRTLVMTGQNIVPGTSFITNTVDKVRLGGTGALTFLTATNTGATGGTLTATLYGSTDKTNFVAISNYALLTAPSTETITNYFYGGTNLTTANSVFLGGTVVNPTAYTAGWATPYIAPAAFTNTGAITLNGTTAVQVGLRLVDCPRYLHVVYNPGGTVTNFTVQTILTAGNQF